MRLIVAAATALLVAACANLGSPPGGPVRTTPPDLKATTPDSGATGITSGSVVFEFDAIVSDRDIENFFIISPRDGTPRVRWRRSRVEVRSGRPLRPNTAYSVTMLPGIADLNNNVMRSGRTVVFSTGPTIPTLSIQGRVFDWQAQRVAPAARVEAIRLPDSLPYVGVADSAGQFLLGPLDDGTYLVRATIDNNRNRAIDPGESWDSTRVTVRGGAPVLEMLAIARDTIPPRLLLVTAADSVTLIAGFDRPLDPTQPFASTFTVQRADSTPLRIARVLTRAQRDSLLRSRADSADTTRRAQTDARIEALVSRLPGQGPPASQARPSRPAPPQEITIELEATTPMTRGSSYRVTATNVRGVTGLARTSDRVVQGPSARDSTAVPPRPPVRPPSGPR